MQEEEEETFENAKVANTFKKTEYSEEDVIVEDGEGEVEGSKVLASSASVEKEKGKPKTKTVTRSRRKKKIVQPPVPGDDKKGEK